MGSVTGRSFFPVMNRVKSPPCPEKKIQWNIMDFGKTYYLITFQDIGWPSTLTKTFLRENYAMETRDASIAAKFVQARLPSSIKLYPAEELCFLIIYKLWSRVTLWSVNKRLFKKVKELGTRLHEICPRRIDLLFVQFGSEAISLTETIHFPLLWQCDAILH